MMSSSENLFDFIDAVRGGNVSQVEELLKEEGIKSLINSLQEGISPLEVACQNHNGHFRMIELLLEKGAKVDKFALEASMKLQDHGLIVNLVQKLLEHNPKVKGWNWHDTMVKACEMGNPELVELLLQYEKWDVSHMFHNVEHQMNYSCYGNALHHAVCSGEVKVLLGSKQSAQLTPEVMKSLVCDACDSDSPEMMTFLLTHEKLSGTDAVNHIFPSGNYGGESVLMKASQKGHYRVVEELLLKCGADIDLQNSNGMSALMLAIREEQSKIVEFLVAKGAKVDLQTVGGDTALSQAVLRKSVKAAEILLDNNASTDDVGTDSLLHQAVGLMDTKMVELLLKKGVPVDRRSQSSRQTALMIACQLCNVELTELLLEYGADVKLLILIKVVNTLYCMQSDVL